MTVTDEVDPRRSTGVPAGYVLDLGRSTFPVGVDYPAHEIYFSADGSCYRRRVLRRTRSRETVVLEEWFTDPAGHPHRGGGLPAEIERRTFEPKRTTEKWFVEGKLSRLDGPAWVSRGADGAVIEQEWVLAGVGGYERHELGIIVKGLTTARFGLEVRSSAFAALLDEGITVEEIRSAFVLGVRTVEGMRALHEGSPVEWVLAFEDGALGSGGRS